MTEIDPRFICRREGHVPALTITSQNVTTGDEPFVYVTSCLRCGKAFEVRDLGASDEGKAP